MMHEIKVRRAIRSDAREMAGILRELGWSKRRNNMKLEEVTKPIEDLIEHSIKDKDGHTVYVAIDKSLNVIGFTNVHWVPFIMLGSYEGYITDVFVRPSASGKGVGTLLVKTVMKEGKVRGCMRLMLTNGKNKPSYKRGFYKQLGWTERPNVANFVYYYKEPWS